jgi:hypothetical protein
VGILLQSRPNRLRAKGPITRARLQLLRECKTLQSAERMRKAELFAASDINPRERYPSESSEPLSAATIEPAISSWLDFDLDSTSTASQSPYLQSGLSTFDHSLNFQHSQSVNTQPPLGPWKTEKAESILGLYEIASAQLSLGEYESIPVPTEISEDWVNTSFRLESPLEKFESSYSDVQPTAEDRDKTLTPPAVQIIESTSEKCERTFSMPEESTAPIAVKQDKHDTRSVLSMGNSSRSIVSLRSLKNRLHSKYSTSFLGDIKSLLERLTISESSERSSTMTGKTSSSKTQSRVSVPTKMEHPVILPGSFPQYCWEHIHHNELRKCDDYKVSTQFAQSEVIANQYFQSPCNCGPIFLGQETHRSIRSDVLFRIRACKVRPDDLDAVDTFKNSVLHIAAALEAPPGYLSRLISMGADVHALNNAKQTFLHTARISSVERILDFHTLIRNLVELQFDFRCQDLNGQTAVHALTEPPTAPDVLNGIVQTLEFYRIDLPTSRDNLGFRVQDQLQEINSKPTLLAIEDSRFSVDGSLFLEQPEASNDVQFEEFSFINRKIQNFKKHDWVENLEDLQQYELHADLLRSIVRSGEDPNFEDGEGRNGLHCLAEVRLDLPIPGKQIDRKPGSDLEFSTTSRERYLDQLLLAGVDPNK